MSRVPRHRGPDLRNQASVADEKGCHTTRVEVMTGPGASLAPCVMPNRM